MKDYIITSNEYDIVTRRLNRLKERRIKLKNDIESITSKLKEVVVNTGFSNDKMSNYVAELEELEKEIEEKEEEASKLKSDLDYMDSRISNINNTKEQVFIMHFIRGMQPKHIALKLPCDVSTVYKKIKEINKEREEAKKSQKFCNII